MNLTAKSGAYGRARHITYIDWRSKGLSDADEEVATILFHLSRLISDSNSFLIWKGKKRRQARKRRRYDVIKKDPATSDAVRDMTTMEEPRSSKQFDTASSPDTPLISSFSPDATNSKHIPKRKPFKRRRQDKLLLVTQLENERDLLRRKIENLRQQKDRAMAINSLLKRQQELIHDNQENEKDEKFEEVNTSLTLQCQWTQPSIILSSAIVQRHGGLGSIVLHQPLIANLTAVVADNSRAILGMCQLMDLNLADRCHELENPQQLDSYVDNKVIATLARQKRCRIYKANRRNLMKGIIL